MEMIYKLINYWKFQNIHVQLNSLDHIRKILESKSIMLPDDFIEYYQQVNGMGELYADFDKEGFSFYPIEELKTLETYHENYYRSRYKDDLGELKNIVIFADYMHESWLYGLNVIDNDTYSIGISALYGQFKVITNSLQDFVKLYLEDSEVLYNYQ
jgi:hypothetical protein